MAQLEGNNEGGEDDVGAGGGVQLEGDHQGRGGGALGSSERVRCVFLDLCVLGLSLLQILYCPHIDQFLIVNGHIHVYHHHTVVSFTYRVADGRYYPKRQRLTLSLQPGQSRPTPVDATKKVKDCLAADASQVVYSRTWASGILQDTLP